MDISVSFSLFVIVTATTILFIDELSSSAKKLWSNNLFRNTGLMFCMGLFTLPYRSTLKIGFLHFFYYLTDLAKSLAPHIFYFDHKFVVAWGILYILTVLLITALVWLLYLILHRKYFNHTFTVLWGTWILIGAMGVFTFMA